MKSYMYNLTSCPTRLNKIQTKLKISKIIGHFVGFMLFKSFIAWDNIQWHTIYGYIHLY